MIFDEAHFITALLSVRLKVGVFAEALAARRVATNGDHPR